MTTKTLVATLVAIIGITAPSFAMADDQPHATVGAFGGSTGAGFSVGFDLPHGTKLRFTEGSLGYGFDGNASGVQYRGGFHPETAAALLDSRPFGGSPFKLTVGGYLTNTSVSFVGHDTNTVTINGTTYAASQVGNVTGEAYWHRFAPYVGTGIDTTPRSGRGVGVVVDAGAFYQGTPTTTLITQFTPADPSFAGNLEQARQTFATQVGHYHVYPVLTVGLATRI